MNRDFIYQTLLRNKLPAMENHSRSAIISTYSPKVSVATALVKREGNRENEREDIWAGMHQHAEQNRDVAGWHKIHVHTYPQRDLEWVNEEENLERKTPWEHSSAASRQHLQTQFRSPGLNKESNRCISKFMLGLEVWFKTDTLNPHKISFKIMNLVIFSMGTFLVLSFFQLEAE